MKIKRNTAAGVQLGVSRGQSAFTTIEVLVASALLGLIATGLYGGITFGFSIIQSTRERLRASQVLQEKLETLRLYKWSQINDASYLPRTFTAPLSPNGTDAFFSGSVTAVSAPLGSETYKADMLQVDVNISWTSLNIPRNVSLRTFVSRHGIQNYSF